MLERIHLLPCQQRDSMAKYPGQQQDSKEKYPAKSQGSAVEDECTSTPSTRLCAMLVVVCRTPSLAIV